MEKVHTAVGRDIEVDVGHDCWNRGDWREVGSSMERVEQIRKGLQEGNKNWVTWKEREFLHGRMAAGEGEGRGVGGG